jgi:MYXO-CTERM domain-containing protein
MSLRIPFAAALVALLSSPALAAPAALDTPEGARAIDPPALPPASLDQPREPQLLGDKIMFVNFDGGDMNDCGNDDPAQNCSTIWGGTIEAYTGDAAKRATVIQILRERVEDFGVTVTDTRPASGDYDMEMVGNWVGLDDPGFAGVAPSIDCWDQRGGETSFTLEAAGTSDGIAEIILQEIAHTWGLEHVDDPLDLLYPITQGQNKVFRDECLKIVYNTDLDPSNGQCNSMHSQFCNTGFQNSYQELLELFGPSIPDTEPPVVEILSPAEGDTIDGNAATMVVRFADNLQPVIINATINIDGTGIDMPVSEDGAYAGPAELEFPINGLPDGEYTISIDATDEYDNPASDQVSFSVVGNPPQGGTEGGSEGGESGGDDASSGVGEAEGGEAGAAEGSVDDDDDDDDSDTDGATAGTDTTNGGCTCMVRSNDAALLWLPLLGLLGLTARRRRC